MPWTIYTDAQGLWYWEMLSATADPVLHSARGHATREACLADARLHGYAEVHTGPIDQGDADGEDDERD